MTLCQILPLKEFYVTPSHLPTFSVCSSHYFSGCPFFPAMDLKLQTLPMFLRIPFIEKKNKGVTTNSICIILVFIISCLFRFKNAPAAECEEEEWTH